MNNKYLFFIFSVVLFSCSSKNNQQELPLEYYTIDLDAEKEEPIPLSSLFGRVRTVILESGDDYMIGQVNIIQVFDGYIYILDSRRAKSLFVFDMEGRFIRKIGNIGNGPGEYIEANDFTLDTENGFIFICDARNRIHKYQFDGTYLHTITIDSPTSKAVLIQFYNGILFSSQIWWNKSEDNYMLLEIDPNNGNILSKSLNIKRYNKGWNELVFDVHSNFFMSRGQNPPRYNQMFMDYIVSIGKEVTPYIELKSKYLTTKADIESFRGKDGMLVNTELLFNSKKKFNVHCFIENDDFVNFRWGGVVSSLSVVLDKKTGEAKLFDYMNNDLVYKQDKKGGLLGFRFSDMKGAYVILEPFTDMISYFQNQIKNNEIVPNLDKLEQLKQLDDDSNPVILFYEYK